MNNTPPAFPETSFDYINLMKRREELVHPTHQHQFASAQKHNLCCNMDQSNSKSLDFESEFRFEQEDRKVRGF